MKIHRKFAIRAIYLLLTLSTVLLLLGSLGYKRDGPTANSVTYVEQVQASVDGGPWQSITLPYCFRGLDPRTPVTITAVITPRHDDGVYIKTVYSPADIYLDDRLVFEFGKRENYPIFMEDPATEIHIVETYGTGEAMELRMELRSPVSRSSLMVHPPMVGTSKELIMERSRMLGLPLVFSMAQIVGGVSLCLISLCIILIDKKGILFLWLGLFSLATGAWAFGENNFSSVIFRESTFLYSLSFVGLFTFIVPLLRFTRTIVDFKDPRPTWALEVLAALSAGIALTLQLAGKVACSKSMYFFHAMLPLDLLILTALTIREYVKYKNLNARRFILPISVLAVTALAELLNYRLPITYVFSSLFQLGILIFLLIMGITAGVYIKDSIDLKNKQKELAFEQDLMEIQVKEQANRSQLLAQHEQLLRQQRHDLRHHLFAVQELVNPENTELLRYLQTLVDQIPQADQCFCENRAVNAVLNHYRGRCEAAGIQLTLQTAVPVCKEDGISDSELCVIFGNLLENAVEACGRMESGQPFIKLRSTVQRGLLTVTMDNSFNGSVTAINGHFRSSKRDEFGIGLTSIGSVAQKYGGDVEFRGKGNVFLSSVYLKL